MTEHVPAVAEGMPKITRRRFLAQIGITTGAIAAGTAAVAVERATAPDEDPELIALGEKMASALAAVRAVNEAHLAAVDLFHRTRPSVPEELRDRLLWMDPERRRGTGLHAAYLQDGFNRTVYVDNRPVMFAPAEEIRKSLRYLDGRTQKARRYKKLLAIVERHEAEDKAARDASNVRRLADKLFGHKRTARISARRYSASRRGRWSASRSRRRLSARRLCSMNTGGLTRSAGGRRWRKTFSPF